MNTTSFDLRSKQQSQAVHYLLLVLHSHDDDKSGSRLRLGSDARKEFDHFTLLGLQRNLIWYELFHDYMAQ